jgi:hypothetical protein
MSAGIVEYSVKIDTQKGTIDLRKVGDIFEEIGEKGESSSNRAGRGLDGLFGKTIQLNQALELAEKAWRMLSGPIGDLIRTASDAEEIQSKFFAVFKNEAPGAINWINQFSGDVGRSKTEIMGWMSTLQDTFVPLGFTREKAAEMSQTLTKLAVDLSSFNNIAESDAIADLQSAIVGNHETMRKYGVIINETTLKQELMNMGVSKGIMAATEAEKAQARLNIIMKGTADAQGDAIRTADQFANRMRSLNATWRDLKELAGQQIIQAIIPYMEKLANWIKENRTQIEAFAQKVGKSIGEFITLIADVIKTIYEWRDVIIEVGKVWLTYFAISKVIAWGTSLSKVLKAVSTDFSGIGKTLENCQAKGMSISSTLMEVTKNSKLASAALQLIGAAIVSWTITKLVKVYELINELVEINEQYSEVMKRQKDANEIARQKFVELESAAYRWIAAQKENNFIVDTTRVALGHMGDRLLAAKDMGEEYHRVIRDIARGNYGPLLQKMWEDLKVEQIQKAVQASDEYKNATQAVKDYVDKHNVSVAEATRIINEQGEAVKKAKGEYDAFAEKLGFFTENRVKKLDSETRMLIATVESMGSQFDTNEEAIGNVSKKIEELKKGYKALSTDAPPQLKAIEAQIGLLKGVTSDTADELEEKFGPAFRDTGIEADFLKTEIVGMRDETGKLIMPTRDYIDVLDDLQIDLGNIAGLAGAAANALASMGAVDLANIAGGIGDLAGGIKQGIGGLGDMIAGGDFLGGLTTMVSAIPGIVKGIKSIIKGISDLLGLGHDWDKWARKVNHAGINVGEFHDKIAKLAEELRKDSMSTYDASFRAFNQTLPEVIRNVYISRDAFNQYAESVHKVFCQLEDIKHGHSAASIEETLSSISDSFTALAEKQKELGNVFSIEMVRMIADAKTCGYEILAINEYVQEQIRVGFEGYKQMLENLDSTEIESQITSLLEKMQGMSEGTSDYIQAQEELAALQKKLSDVQAAQEVFGGVSIGIFDEMLDYENKVAENPALINAIKGWEQAMMSLSNTQFITQEQFTDFGNIAVASYEKLIAAGFTSEQALQTLQPQLQRIVDLQKAYGFQVDESTQKIIDQAAEEGMLHGQTLSHSEKEIALMEEIVKLLGGDIPYHLSNLSSTVEGSLSRIQGDTESWRKGLGDVKDEIIDIQDEVKNLDDIYHDEMITHSIVSDTEEWYSKLVQIGDKFYQLEEVAEIFGYKYAYFSQTMADTTEEDWMASLDEILDAFGIELPDYLDSMADKYEYIMSLMGDESEGFYVTTEGYFASLIDMLRAFGQEMSETIGSNYGVYTQEEKEEMTAKFFAMQELWWSSMSTIMSSQSNYTRFINDLKSLVVVDEIKDMYDRFVNQVEEIWMRHQQQIQNQNQPDDNIQAPQMQTGGHFIVPSWLDEMPIIVHPNELVQVYTPEQTQQILNFLSRMRHTPDIDIPEESDEPFDPTLIASVTHRRVGSDSSPGSPNPYQIEPQQNVTVNENKNTYIYNIYIHKDAKSEDADSIVDAFFEAIDDNHEYGEKLVKTVRKYE